MSAVASTVSDVDLELSIVGSFYLDPRAFDIYGDRLDAGWFSDELAGSIYSHARQAHFEHGALSPSAIMAGLPDFGNQSTPAKLFARACAQAMPIDTIPGMVAALREKWARRSLLSLADDMQSEAKTYGASPFAMAKEAVARLDEINAAQNAHAAGFLNKGIDSLIDGLRESKNLRGSTTGFRILDEKLNGYCKRQFYVLAGRPAMGKSALAVSSLRRTAAAGHGVAIFSLEMSKEEIAARIISDGLDDPLAPPYGAILRGAISPAQFEMVDTARDSLDGLPIYIDDAPSLSISEIAARARKARTMLEAQGYSLDVVCIDHMGLVTPAERYRGNKVAEATEVSNGLRAMAKELDCCVLALSQLNRQVESRDDKRPVLSDLRETGAIEQDAHVVAFVFRPFYYLKQDQNVSDHDLMAVKDDLEFLIRKNRNGETGDVNLRCRISHSQVKE